MLTFIRDRAQGWIAMVIVGLLIIPFALWGINEYFGSGGQLVVANVNDTEISQREFQRAFYEQRDLTRQALGKQYDARIFDPQIKKRVIKELVDQELLLQNAEDVGYRISEATIVSTIRDVDAFREDGVFSTDLYEQQLRAQDLSSAGFEQRVRRIMLTSQLPAGLTGSVLVTESDINTAIRIQEQKRIVQHLILSVNKYKDDSVADEDSIKSYYENNSDRFMTNEKVSVEYVELSLANIATNMKKNEKPSEEQLRQFFESSYNQTGTPEERKARHILIQVGEGSDDETINAARDKANVVLGKIKSGESFEKLAEEYSDDPGSSKIGGDLGLFGPGIMDPEFERVAFSLNNGEVSEPVLTQFGFHIIKVYEILKPETKKFEDVRADLILEFHKDAAEKKYFDLAERLTNLAYESPDSLSEVADELELKLKQSPAIGRNGGPGIFSMPRIVNAAFSDDVLIQGYNSEPLEIAENHVVVLRLLEHNEASQLPLDTVHDQVKKLLVQDKAKEKAKEIGINAINQLKEGKTDRSIAGKLGASWKEAVAIDRKSKKIDPVIVKQAFKMVKPAANVKSFDGVGLPNGDFAIIALNKVVEGNPEALDAAAREKIKNRLVSELSANVQNNLLTTLRKQAVINVQEDEL